MRPSGMASVDGHADKPVRVRPNSGVSVTASRGTSVGRGFWENTLRHCEGPFVLIWTEAVSQTVRLLRPASSEGGLAMTEPARNVAFPTVVLSMDGSLRGDRSSLSCPKRLLHLIPELRLIRNDGWVSRTIPALRLIRNGGVGFLAEHHGREPSMAAMKPVGVRRALSRFRHCEGHAVWGGPKQSLRCVRLLQSLTELRLIRNDGVGVLAEHHGRGSSTAVERSAPERPMLGTFRFGPFDRDALRRTQGPARVSLDSRGIGPSTGAT